jgi:hypothetical protein
MHNLFDAQALVEVVITQPMRHIHTQVTQVIYLREHRRSNQAAHTQ